MAYIISMIFLVAERFEQMMTGLRSDLTNNPPLPGSFTPHKGDMCAGLFIDNLW